MTDFDFQAQEIPALAPEKPKRNTRRKKSLDTPQLEETPIQQANTDEYPETHIDNIKDNAKDTPDFVSQELSDVISTTESTHTISVQSRRESSILTIRNRDDVETVEDKEDVIWHEIHNAYRTRRILTGQLGGIEQLDNGKTIAIVDYKGFRILIPIKEMMINLGRSPSGQEYADLMLRQNKIIGNMLGADIDFIVRGIDSKTRSVVASRREAMIRKRQIFYFDTNADGTYRIHEDRIVQARVIAVAHSCYDYRTPEKKDDVSFAVTRLDMERGVAVGIITRIIRQNL